MDLNLAWWGEARTEVDGTRIVRGENRGEYRDNEEHGKNCKPEQRQRILEVGTKQARQPRTASVGDERPMEWLGAGRFHERRHSVVPHAWVKVGVGQISHQVDQHENGGTDGREGDDGW